MLYDSKRLIMTTAMASELNVLAHMLDRIGESNRKSRDFTLESLRDVIREVVACFPVYRTYVDEDGWTPADRAVVEQAIARARRRNPAMESSLFDFFREVVLPRDPDDAAAGRPAAERRGGYPPADANEARERLRFAMKLQQYTGPVQAKGLEDTAFYRYNVLLSVNEVGGDPSRFGRSVEEFHDANAQRALDWPFEMLATATHDTKLGEDVRARINVLSEMPDEWGREVSRWMRINRAQRRLVDGDPAPDRNDEYRLYQVLLGAWPVGPARRRRRGARGIHRAHRGLHAQGGARSQGPHELADDQPGLRGRADRVRRADPRACRRPEVPPRVPAVPAADRLARRGQSLAQVVLKLGSPGVPDFYQGTELWDLSLVDPDNRRPVDFDAAASACSSAATTAAPDPDELLRELAATAGSSCSSPRAGLRLRRELPRRVRRRRLPAARRRRSACRPTPSRSRGVSGGRCGDRRSRRALCSAWSTRRRPVPLGGECWKTSRVMLPEALRHRTFRNVLHRRRRSGRR